MSFNVLIGGVVRHITYCTYPSQVATNKRDWQCVSLTGGSSVGSAATITELDTLFAGLVKPCMTADADYYGSQLYYQTPVGAPPRPESFIGNAGPGSDAGEALPLQTSGLISLYSDTLGKTGQGRIYVPFPSIDSQGTDSTPDALYNVDLSNLATSLITPRTVTDGAVTAIFNPVLYKPGGAPPLQLTRAVPRDAWATQRRRGNFGRVNNRPF